VHGLIRQSAFASDIHSLGFVSDEELPTLYRAADLFVFPSLFEGFGLPPVEAMACGCPVLSSARGGLEEVIGDAAAILDPECTADIQAQLTRLAGDLHALEKLRVKGLAQAAKFDWRLTAAATLKAYTDAVAKNKKTPPTGTRVPLLRANSRPERMGSLAKLIRV
jgi:glycosyltransferase involved in cell wall biosynthesis